MKIAYFSPLNPIKSGVADYSEELLEYLSGYGKIELFVDDYEPSSEWLCDHFEVHNYRRIYENHGRNDFDVNIYHMGNNDHHSYIHSVLLEYPGIVVLHEPMLHHFVFSQTVGDGRLKEYLRELDYCYKSERQVVVKTTLEARDEDSWYDYPLLNRIVDSSLGVIVHSDFAKSIVLDVNPRAMVRKICHHYAPPPVGHMRSPELLREVLGVAPGSFLFGSLGYITASKRIDAVLNVLASLKAEGYPVKLLLVGKLLPGCEALRSIEELGLGQDVIVTGFVDTRTFREYLTVPDAFIALRHPSAGETSGSVIKMMGTGKPIILSDHHAFSEMPDNCCLKVSTGEYEEQELREKLLILVDDPDLCSRIGENARRNVMVNNDIQSSARQYVEFASEVLTGRRI